METLAYLDKNAHPEVIVDAGPVGSGSVLVQYHSNMPLMVAYASRSLRDSERRYSETETEALTLVSGCEKVYSYLYGVRIDQNCVLGLSDGC